MIYLEPGDRLPVVATLQARLNLHFGGTERLRVDGNFGSNTLGTLKDFQQEKAPAFRGSRLNDETRFKLMTPPGGGDDGGLTLRLGGRRVVTLRAGPVVSRLWGE